MNKKLSLLSMEEDEQIVDDTVVVVNKINPMVFSGSIQERIEKFDAIGDTIIDATDGSAIVDDLTDSLDTTVAAHNTLEVITDTHAQTSVIDSSAAGNAIMVTMESFKKMILKNPTPRSVVFEEFSTKRTQLKVSQEGFEEIKKTIELIFARIMEIIRSLAAWIKRTFMRLKDRGARMFARGKKVKEAVKETVEKKSEEVEKHSTRTKSDGTVVHTHTKGNFSTVYVETEEPKTKHCPTANAILHVDGKVVTGGELLIKMREYLSESADNVTLMETVLDNASQTISRVMESFDKNTDDYMDALNKARSSLIAKYKNLHLKHREDTAVEGMTTFYNDLIFGDRQFFLSCVDTDTVVDVPFANINAVSAGVRSGNKEPVESTELEGFETTDGLVSAVNDIIDGMDKNRKKLTALNERAMRFVEEIDRKLNYLRNRYSKNSKDESGVKRTAARSKAVAQLLGMYSNLANGGAKLQLYQEQVNSAFLDYLEVFAVDKNI